MRVAYYSSPSFADCDFPLIREYQKKGIEIVYFIKLTPYNRHSTLIDIKEQIPINGILKLSDYKESKLFADYLNIENVYIVNQVSPKNLSFSSLWLFFKFVRLLLNLKVDVIHSLNLVDFDSLLLFFRRKLVITLHDPFPHTGEGGRRREFFRRLMIHFSRKIILLNQVQEKDFMDIYHVKNDKIVINRLGVYDAVAIYDNNLSVKSNSNNILFFGRISPYKGIEYLLEAMDEVHESYPDANCTIMGSGHLYMDQSYYMNRSYIKIINRFIPMEELIRAIKHATMVVCPYTDATQSGVVYTAYALRKPVIATTVGDFSECVINDQTGILVPPKDSKKLGEAILYLLENPDVCERMSSCINQNIKHGLFSWNDIASIYIDTYTKL